MEDWAFIRYTLLEKDEELIENVFRRASKLIPGISNFLYVNGLRGIDIPSVKYRRIRDDMVQVYKILHGEDESLKAFFNVNSTSIRDNFKLTKALVKNKVCKHFCTTLVINDWNSSPTAVVIRQFQNKIWQYMVWLKVRILNFNLFLYIKIHKF